LDRSPVPDYKQLRYKFLSSRNNPHICQLSDPLWVSSKFDGWGQDHHPEIG